MKKSRIGILNVKAEEKKVTKQTQKVEKSENKIIYENVVKEREISIADGVKLVISVSKTKDGRPHVDIRTHITSEKYTGPTKKGINFDLEYLTELISELSDLDIELEEKGL